MRLPSRSVDALRPKPRIPANSRLTHRNAPASSRLPTAPTTGPGTGARPAPGGKSSVKRKTRMSPNRTIGGAISLARASDRRSLAASRNILRTLVMPR